MDRPILEAKLDAALAQPDNEWCVYEICKVLALSPEGCLEMLTEAALELPTITVLKGVDEYRHSAWPDLVARGKAVMGGVCLPVAVAGPDRRTA